MRYYKVYAKCVYSSRPVREIGISEVYNCINELFDYNLDEYSWKDKAEDLTEEDWARIDSRLYDIISKVWQEKGFLQCGDYAIYRVEDDEDIPKRSNMYGWDLFIDEI